VKTTPAKKKTRRTKKTVSIPSPLLGQLNPFLKNAQPRIADGAANKSISSSYRTTNAVTITAGNIGHFMFVPGLKTGLFWTDGVPTGANMNRADYNNGSDITFSIPGWASNPGVPTAREIDAATNIAKYRLVSQGLRLTCIDNDQNNDGFYEAVRVNRPRNALDWTIEGLTANMNDVYLEPIVSAGLGLPDLVSSSITDDDSYMCGSIKSLANKQFNLKPTKDEVRFKNFRERCLATFQETIPAVPHSHIYAVNEGDDDIFAVWENMMDLEYDILYIRIHPGSTNNANLLVETCVNWEFIFDQTSSLARYMDPGYKLPMQDNVTAARNATPMAAESRPQSDGMVSKGESTFDRIKDVGGWAADSLMYAWQNPDSVTGRILSAALKGTAEYFVPGITSPPNPLPPLPVSSSDRQLVPYEYTGRVRTSGSKYQKTIIGEDMEEEIIHA
jgi:hypothetical protein